MTEIQKITPIQHVTPASSTLQTVATLQFGSQLTPNSCSCICPDSKSYVYRKYTCVALQPMPYTAVQLLCPAPATLTLVYEAAHLDKRPALESCIHKVTSHAKLADR
jgi:hypothetical protein